MKVVLDSTVFRADMQMQGMQFRVLFDEMASIPASLVIPEVVVDEVVNAYREALELEKRHYYVQIDKLRRLIPRRTGRKPPIDVQRHVNEYKMRLVAKIEEHGSILPYPDIPHKQIVSRVLARRKPFGTKDAGYRDYLIWVGIKSQLVMGSERLVFVTANSKDFGDGELHPDFASDILNPSRLTLVQDLAEFNTQFVTPRLNLLGALKVELESGGAKFDAAAWVHANFAEVIDSDGLIMAVTPFPAGIGSAHLVDVVRYDSIKIQGAGEMSSGDYFVTVEVVAEIEVSVDVDGDDYAKSPEARDWVGGYLGEYDFAKSNHSCVVKAVVELIVDPSTNEVTSHFLEALNPS